MKLPYEPAAALAAQLLEAKVVDRIWSRDPSVWKAQPGSADEKSIATRLGWLDVATTMKPHVERLKTLAQEVHAEKVEAIYLLGMGGSSLCAEVLKSVFGIAPGYPELAVLDTTDERTLVNAAERMNP